MTQQQTTEVVKPFVRSTSTAMHVQLEYADHPGWVACSSWPLPGSEKQAAEALKRRRREYPRVAWRLVEITVTTTTVVRDLRA